MGRKASLKMCRRIEWAAAILLILAVVLPGHALGGSGRIVDGKLELSVAFTYREADIEAWRPLFEEASRLLWNATNGQLQIGKVRVGDCGLDKEEADIWILDGNSGAFANLLGLGGQGHIYLSQTHKSVAAPALGYFGVVHEFGHYGFGVFDEYKGYQPPPLFARAGTDASAEQVGRSQPFQFCVTEEDLVACIMDGGTTVEPNNHRTEFCTGAHGDLTTKHNEGFEQDGVLYVNAQQALLGESCWETIGRNASLQPPLEVDPADPPGLEPIDWEVIPSVSRVALCIDRSSSMFARPERITLAREAASVLIQLLHTRRTLDLDGEPITLPGEELGIIAFAHEAEQLLAMRELLTDATKDSAAALVAAIDRVISNRRATDMAAGLGEGLETILERGEIPACGEVLVLFSDGATNIGFDPMSIVPALRERGVRVISIGIGAEVGEETLRALADSTGGSYFQIVTEEEIPDVVAAASQEIRSTGTLFTDDDFTNGQDESIPILIDSFAEEVTFLLDWDESTLDMSLTTPSGETITVESADILENVEAERQDGLVYIRVSRPEQGMWQANVSPLGNPDPIAFTLQVLDENRTIQITVTTDQELYGPTTPVHLRVDVVAEAPVAGAEVTAVVERPAGDPVDIVLYDDGEAAHGDTWANDGVYNTFFGNYTIDGIYTFHVLVRNENGTGPDPDLPFVEDGPGPPQSIPPFVREADVSVRVEGILGTVTGTLDFSPNSLNVYNRHGRVSCLVELPEPYDAGQIVVESVRLNDVVAPLEGSAAVGDVDEDGIPDLLLKFDRGAVIDALPNGMEVAVRLSGVLAGGETFEAIDHIRVFEPGDDWPVGVAPEVAWVGAAATLTWVPVPDEPVTYSGYVSTDGGLTWRSIFGPIAEVSGTEWIVDVAPGDGILVLVEVGSPEGVVRQGLSRPFSVRDAATDAPALPRATRFRGLQPNPNRGTVRLAYDLAVPTSVRLEIYDVMGRLVQRLVDVQQPAGQHAVAWTGTDLHGRQVSSGLYFYVFQAGESQARGSLMLLR